MNSIKSFKTVLKAVVDPTDDMFVYPSWPYVMGVIFLGALFVIGSIAALVSYLI